MRAVSVKGSDLGPQKLCRPSQYLPWHDVLVAPTRQDHAGKKRRFYYWQIMAIRYIFNKHSKKKQRAGRLHQCRRAGAPPHCYI